MRLCFFPLPEKSSLFHRGVVSLHLYGIDDQPGGVLPSTNEGVDNVGPVLELSSRSTPGNEGVEVGHGQGIVFTYRDGF